MFNYILTIARMSVRITPLDPAKHIVTHIEFPVIEYAGNTPISIETHKSNINVILTSALKQRIELMLAQTGVSKEEAIISTEVKLLEAELPEGEIGNYLRLF